jgi:hypothetical protein
VLTEDGDILDGRYEGLVAPAVFVVDILADDLPGRDVEEILLEDFVRVGEAVEDESDEFLLKRILCN